MHAELKVLPFILFALLPIFTLFIPTITYSQSNLKIQPDQQTYLQGIQLKITCFGKIQIYKNNILKKEAIGKLIYTPQEPGKYEIKCEDEIRTIVVNPLFQKQNNQPDQSNTTQLPQSTNQTNQTQSKQPTKPQISQPTNQVKWILKYPDKFSVQSIKYGPLKPLTGKDSQGRPITETAIGKNFVLSSYNTDFELVSYHSSPVSQRITFRIFNNKEKNFSYIAIATSGELKSFRAWHLVNKTAIKTLVKTETYPGNQTSSFNDAIYIEPYIDEESNKSEGNYTVVYFRHNITYNYTAREYDEVKFLFLTTRFIDEWNSGDVFSRIKKYLQEKNISTNLNQILHNSVLPEDNQRVYVYKVPHQPNTWEYFEYETDNTPSKFLAFDPAGGSWWNESWNYTREITIQENSNTTLEEYQITIYLDTKTLISQGKMNSDCSDIRFVWYNESSQDYVDVPYYIDESPGLACNTSNTLIWIKVPIIQANSNTTISLYYGNPGAESESDIVEVFTYSKPKEIYFAIGDFVQRSDIDIISYSDNNQVTLNSNGESITLNRGDIYAGYDASDIQPADSWNVTGPLAFGCPGVDCDTPNPISFAGTEFIRFVDRGGTDKEWFVYAPFSNGTVYFYQAPSGGSFTLIKTLNVEKRTLYTVTDADGTDDYIFLINSTTPILLAFEYSSSDTQMYVPSNKDVWGISEDVAYGYPNTERTLCTQSAACSTSVINGPYRENLGADTDGQGTATHINATKNFGQGQTADSDGYESLVFWPEKELSKEYLIPVAFQYLAGSLTKGSTNSCSWRNGTAGAWTSFTPSGSYDYPNPKKIYIGENDNDPADSYGMAGSIINCTHPFFLYIEPNNDDEANILSWKQARQYIWPEPTVVVGDEWNKSEPRLQANAEFLDTTNIYENQSIILKGNCSEIFGLENATEVYITLQDNSSGIWNNTPTTGNVSSNVTSYYLGTIENGTTKTRHFNITVRNQGEYLFRIVCNSTNAKTSYSTAKKLTVSKAYGQLGFSLISPPPGETTEEEIYENFLVNATVLCSGPTSYVNCPEVNATVYYSSADSWAYRKQINITETSGTNLTDYQIELLIDTYSLISQGKLNPDCSDLRFKYPNGDVIPYWIQQGCNTTQTRIWIRLNLTASESKTIYMYYGNPFAESKSNISSVFDFMEFGKLNVTDEQYTTVTLQHVYRHSIVVASPEYPHGPSAPPYPMGVIIKDVTPTSFKVKVDRPSGTLTDTITTVHYIVMENGSWYPLSSNVLIQAGEINTTKDSFYNSTGAYFGSPNYAEIVQFPVPFSSSPVVLHTRVSENNALWAVTYVGAVGDRNNIPNSTHMDLGLLSGQLGDQNFVNNETLHWIAIENNNAGEFNGTKWSAEISADVVQGFANSPYYWTTSFTQTYSSTPEVIVVGKIKEDGGNGAWAVLSKGDSSASAWASFVDETLETDRAHTHEVVDAISFSSSGSIPIRKYASSLPIISFGDEDKLMLPVNTSLDTPFYTISDQPQSCGNMSYGDSCALTWLINSTGELNSQWMLLVEFESSEPNIKSNETKYAIVKIVDLTAPKWSDLTANNTTPDPGDFVEFSVNWTDNYNLSSWIFSWNCTPDFSWQNDTFGAFSGTINRSNVTKEIPIYCADKSVGYKFYANDTSGNQNVTDIGTIKVNPVPDTIPPTINKFNASPTIQGYGQLVKIWANVTDNVGIEWVKANITYPNGSSTQIQLPYSGTPDIYEAYFNNTWQWGNYSYFIIANDTSGNSNDTSANPKEFYVRANASIELNTIEDVYGANDNVLLTYGDWWNLSWQYRIPIVINETSGNNLTNFQINFVIDTKSLISEGKMNSDCSDIRIIDEANETELNYWIQSNCNSTNTKIWVKLNLTANSVKTIYVYYGNPDANSLSNYTKTFILIGEANEIVANSTWKIVNFTNIYPDTPVVFADMTFNDTTQAQRRIDNVTPENFSIRAESYLSPYTHGDETIYWIALRKGKWWIGGKLFVVGNSSINSVEWQDVPFGHTFSSNPLVITDLQTVNEVDPAHTRHNSRDKDSIQSKVEEPGDAAHTYEEIAFVAIDSSGICDINLTNGKKCEAGISSSSGVNWNTITFTAGFTEKPIMIMTMMTHNGGDEADLRYRNEGSSSWQYKLEETPDDDNTGHLTETFAWFAIEKGSIYGAKYASSEPTVNLGCEEEKTSMIIDTGSTNISGYLLIQIYKNSTNELISTQINDSETKTERNIYSKEFLDIGQIYNQNPWNTNSYESGYYKIVASLTDPDGNILRNDNGTDITNYYIFYLDIISPSWSNLGANNTNPKPLDYVKFYCNWSDNGQLDSWEFYWNATGMWEKVGSGTFMTNPDWSNITLQIPTEAEAKAVGYYFKANDTEGSYNTTDIYTIEVQDITPPDISNEQVKPSVIHRNETVNITATITDNKDVNETWVEIGVPNNGYINESMTLLSGPIYNLTYKSTEIGVYNFTVYANDSSGNLGNGSLYTWKVYGWSNVTWIAPIDGSYPIGTIINLTCQVRDVNTTQGIENYPVTFKHDGDIIGTNLTNSSGYATISWDTSGLEGGFHTVRCEIEDNSTLFYNTTVDSANTTIEILVPDVNVTDLKHENQYEHGINEYETGDTIQWVNVTVNNTGGAKAYSVNVSLNILDANNQVVDWFSTQTQNCNDLEVGQTCEIQFSSATIPTTATQGTYRWNITTTWSGGGTPPNYNTTITFIIHNLQDNFSSSLSREKIVINQSAIYNFTIFNPWSSNLTNVNVTVNCPINSTCHCALAGQENQEYCFLNSIESSQNKTASFNITTNDSTPIGDHIINVNLTYTNPGNEIRQWNEQGNQTLSVRGPTVLRVTITDYPTIVTRNSLISLKGYVNNTGNYQVNNTWLNWTLPNGWSNQTGNLSQFIGNLTPGEIGWNNITANVSISSQLGAQEIELRAVGDEEPEDWDMITITVYANTSIPYVNISNISPYRNQTVTVIARLVYDNGTAISGEIIDFYLDSHYLGSNVTNSSGYATLTNQIPWNATLGTNRINATYAGSSTLYTNPSYNDSVNVTVKDEIKIGNVSATPQIVGYGFNVTILADVWSRVTIDTVRANITYPNGSSTILVLINQANNIYKGTFNNTWQWGNYSYFIIANNSAGFENNTFPSQKFYVRANASLSLTTEKDSYGPYQDVYLMASNWWNSSWLYRKKILITNSYSSDLEEYQIYLAINTTQLYSEGKINSDCSDIRFIWYNSTGGKNEKLDYYIESCNTTETSYIWVKVPFIGANSTATIYMYYGNPSATSESNLTSTFSYSEPRTIGYVVSDQIVTNGLAILSLCDNNTVVVGPNSYNLSEMQSTTISTGLSKNTSIKAKCLVQVEGNGAYDDIIVPVSWASTEFIYSGFRDSSDTFCMLAPFGDASVSIYSGGAIEWSGTVTSSGTCANFNAANGVSLRIVASKPILVAYYGIPNDAWSFYPATTEKLYGVASNYIIVGAGPDGATITYTRSDTGSTTSTNIAPNEDYLLDKLGDSGTAPAFVVNGSNPIGAIQQADHDGTESTTFAPLKEMTTKFGSALAAEYVTMATPYANTNCTLYNSAGSILATNTTTGSNGIYKICFYCGSDASNIPAGWKVECNASVWPYYETDNSGEDGTETNLLGWKQMRQYVYPEPTYTLKNEERLAILRNIDTANISGYLLMQIYRNDTNQLVATQINDTETGTKRTILSGSYLNLAQIWNSNPWNTSEYENGTYKVYVAFVDSEGNVLKNDNGSYINATYLFYLNSVKVDITVNLTTELEENTTIKIYNFAGNLIKEGQENITTMVESGLLYDIVLSTPLDAGIQKTTIKNVNITKDLSVTSQIIENYTGNKPVGIASITPIYAMEDLNVNYSHVELVIPKNNLNVTRILHCTNWNFTSSNCLNWEVNDSSDYNMQENSTHFWFNVTEFDGYGGGEVIWLEVHLMLPPSIPGKGSAESNAGYKVGQNKVFILKANVTCRNGNCGTVKGTVRYNSSGAEPDTAISTTYATPFYIVNSSNGSAQNPVSCGNLNVNESCILNWTINSTGELHTLWKLDVMFNASGTGNNTNYTIIEITKILLMNLSFTEVDFGVVNPATSGDQNPALDNGNYYVLVHSNSNTIDSLWIKGTDLEPQGNAGYGNISYIIGVGNITWNNESNYAYSKSLTKYYQLVASNLKGGQNQSLYFWISGPRGIEAQEYRGKLYILGNSTT